MKITTTINKSTSSLVSRPSHTPGFLPFSPSALSQSLMDSSFFLLNDGILHCLVLSLLLLFFAPSTWCRDDFTHPSSLDSLLLADVAMTTYPAQASLPSSTNSLLSSWMVHGHLKLNVSQPWADYLLSLKRDPHSCS